MFIFPVLLRFIVPDYMVISTWSTHATTGAMTCPSGNVHEVSVDHASLFLNQFSFTDTKLQQMSLLTIFFQIIKIIEDIENLVLANTFRHTSSCSIFLNMLQDENYESKIEISLLLFLDFSLCSLLDLIKTPLNNAVSAITSLFCSSLKLGKFIRRLCSLSSATAAFVYAW